jgi:hypothetical protein
MLSQVKNTESYSKTATANTGFQVLVKPQKDLTPVVTSLDYEQAATVHVNTIMSPVWDTTLSAAALISATSIVLTEDLGTGSRIGAPAANDIIVIELANGTFEINTISAWNAGTKTATVTALSAAASAGARVWVFGAVADHTNFTWVAVASVRATHSDAAAGLWTGKRSAPLIFDCPNLTAAGYVRRMSVAYCDYGRK